VFNFAARKYVVFNEHRLITNILEPCISPLFKDGQNVYWTN